MMTDAGAGSVSFADEDVEQCDTAVEETAPVEVRSKGKSSPKVAKRSRRTRNKAVKAKPQGNAPAEATLIEGDVAPIEELPLPTQVNVDFLRGITKVREAEQLARAFVEKNFDAPNASYVYVQKWRDGCVIEMQEGGGYAYLPEVLAKLDEDENAVVAVPMSGRMLQVRIDHETGMLSAVLLATAKEPPADAFIALPTAKMSAFDRRGSKVFAAGVGLLAASSLALAFSIGALFIDTKAWALPYVGLTDAADLPSAQFDRLSEALGGADCIAKMEYAGGQWRFVQGWNSDGVCSSSAQPMASQVVPGGSEAALQPSEAPPLTTGAPAPPVPGDM